VFTLKSGHSDLNINEIEKLQDIYYKKQFKKDEVIFFEGEKGQGLYLIKKGKVKLVKMTEDGEELILNIYQDHEVFAEIVMFDSGPYPATAIAMKNSTIYLIETKNMNLLINKYPDITLKIFKVITERLRRAQESIRDLGLRNSKSRTASILLYLANRHGIIINNKIEIGLTITQQDLANMIGTSRETVSRILNTFKKKGYIETSRKNIYILDKDKLKKEM